MTPRTENYYKAVAQLIPEKARMLGDLDHPDEYASYRWLLAERSNINTNEWALSGHDTIEQAFRENTHNEYAQDWEPRFLVDLDTGQVQSLLRTFLVSFDPYAEEMTL